MEASQWIPWLAVLLMFALPQITDAIKARNGHGTGNTLAFESAQQALAMLKTTNEQLIKRIEDQDERLDKQAVQIVTQAAQINGLEMRDRVNHRQIERMRGQLIAQGLTPPTFEDIATELGISPAIFDESYQRLRSELVQAFSEGELTILAVDTGVRPDDIKRGSLVEAAAELIGIAKRTNRLPRLREEILRVRPGFPRDALERMT